MQKYSNGELKGLVQKIGCVDEEIQLFIDSVPLAPVHDKRMAD
jgi:hypothetical protein